MNFLELIFWFLVSLSLICALGGIFLVFYLGRNKVKEIDKLVYGFEIPSDSIFYKVQRIPSYGGAFAWRWGAKRNKIEYIRDKFDKGFQKPFILTFWLFVIGVVALLIVFLIDKFYLHIT